MTQAVYEVKKPFSNGLTHSGVGTQVTLDKAVAEASVLSGHLAELKEAPAGEAAEGDGGAGKGKAK